MTQPSHTDLPIMQLRWLHTGNRPCRELERNGVATHEHPHLPRAPPMSLCLTLGSVRSHMMRSLDIFLGQNRAEYSIISISLPRSLLSFHHDAWVTSAFQSADRCHTIREHTGEHIARLPARVMKSQEITELPS